MSTGPVILVVALLALLASILIGPLGQAFAARLRGRTRQHTLEARGHQAERAARTGPSEATTKTFTARFSVGSRVRVGNRARLASILAEWPYDNRLTVEQLKYAGRKSGVASVTVRHGGHVFYGLDDAPGLWHDACVDAEE
jgi:hypothetical protein